jgi:hypothetical protein
VPKTSLGLGVLDFQVGEGGLAARAPVDHVLAAVDETLFVEADEDFAHRAREAGIEGEALAAPVAACSQADHLALDAIAILRLPFPHAFDEFLAPHGAPVEALFRELALDYHLRGDAGVVGAGQPERIVAAHAMPADSDIDFGVLQHVADMQRTGDVGRRNNERKDARQRLFGGVEDAGVNPPLRPVRFEPLGLVNLIDLHGKYYDIRRC